MELFADRFLRAASSHVVDLASGHRVVLRESAPGDALEQARWADRCVARSRLRHVARARLIDFGVCARGTRFEAYGPAAEDEWLGEAEPVTERRSGPRRAVRRLPPPIVAVALQPRRALGELLAVADDPCDAAGRLRVIALRGDRGAGRSTLLERLAREARLRGYVPVRASLLTGSAGRAGEPGPLHAGLGLLAGRHLLILDDGSPGGDMDELARLVVHLGTAGTRAHLVVTTCRTRGACLAVDMDRLSAAQLAAMVRVHRHYRDEAGFAVTSAARLAEGAPGAFLDRLRRMLSGTTTLAAGGVAPGVAAVAEEAAAYRVATPTSDDGAHESRRAAGAGPRSADEGVNRSLDHARAEEELAAQMARLKSGRHAARERHLRSCLGAAVRRHEHLRAGLAGVWLGRLLLDRGRAADAAATFLSAREHFDRAHDTAGCVVAGTWAGLAWTDDGRLNEAEAVLAAARTAARQVEVDGTQLQARAGLALARCLFWQGRYEEARLVLAAAGVTHDGSGGGRGADAWQAGSGLRLLHATLAARVALGEGALAQAVHHARAAEQWASAEGGPRAVALSSITRGLVCLKVADIDTLRRIVPAGLSAARDAAAPLLALRLRVLALLACDVAGDRQEVRRLRRHLGRASARVLPRLLRARVLQAWLMYEAPSAPPGAVKRLQAELETFRRDSGAEALRLFDVDRRTIASGAPTPPAVQAVIELLGICQESADERTALSRVAGLLKDRLRASAVAVHVLQNGRLAPCLWVGGGRPPDLETAQRALDLNHPVPPPSSHTGRDAAVPIRCGATTVGALGCRWGAGADVDADGVLALLVTAAAAIALHVRCLGATGSVAVRPAGDGELVGTSEAMQVLRRSVERAAPTPFGVLIEGESGAGKELVARAIHRLGPRRDRPFCGLNCAALPDDLFESELFGHAKGAFTGAAVERPGLFEEADGGTLFMDEVGELSPRAQAKLLRVLQEGEVRRLGETHARRIDVRVVAATNRSLREESAAGRFRRDLLYRLDVIRIVVPPLRERLEDLPALATFFWERASGRIGSRAVLAPETLAALARYDWPGNVRELQNVMTTLAVSGPRRGLVRPEGLPDALGLPRRAEWRTLEDARRAFEARFVRMVLARAGGHRGRAAAELGLTRQGLAKLIARLAIETAGPPAAAGPAPPDADDAGEG